MSELLPTPPPPPPPSSGSGSGRGGWNSGSPSAGALLATLFFGAQRDVVAGPRVAAALELLSMAATWVLPVWLLYVALRGVARGTGEAFRAGLIPGLGRDTAPRVGEALRAGRADAGRDTAPRLGRGRGWGEALACKLGDRIAHGQIIAACITAVGGPAVAWLLRRSGLDPSGGGGAGG